MFEILRIKVKKEKSFSFWFFTSISNFCMENFFFICKVYTLRKVAKQEKCEEKITHKLTKQKSLFNDLLLCIFMCMFAYIYEFLHQRSEEVLIVFLEAFSVLLSRESFQCVLPPASSVVAVSNCTFIKLLLLFSISIPSVSLFTCFLVLTNIFKFNTLRLLFLGKWVPLPLRLSYRMWPFVLLNQVLWDFIGVDEGI